MARYVKGGHRLRKALRQHAKRYERPATLVGWDNRDLALRALRNEYGASGPRGDTPAEFFLSRAIEDAKPEVAGALRRGAQSGNTDAGLAEAGRKLQGSIRESIKTHDLIQTGDLHKHVKVERRKA